MSALASRPALGGLPSPLPVRAMATTDLDAVEAIEQRNYEFPWTRGNLSDSLLAGYSCCVLDWADEILGYAILMQGVDEVHLLNFSIAGPWQGHGLGRRFLAWLCDDLCRRGVGSMLLEVRPSNSAALRLYESFGFRRIGLRKGYYPAHQQTREDAIVMKWSSGS